MHMELRSVLKGLAALACLALAACVPRTEISVTANADAKYAHVYVTASALWFNTSATALPQDSTWLKYPLPAPVTIDLAAGGSDTVVQLATDVKLTPGTYAQLRVIPVDSSTVLTSAAKALGALYNSEVDYTASDGTLVQAPLELLNPEAGIAMRGTLDVPRGEVTGSTSTDATTFTLGLAFDLSRDLIELNDGSGSSMLFSPHASAYDLRLAGAVTGTIEVAALTGVATQNGRTDIQVTAETVSADGTRHVPVLSVPVRSDGTFTLYPLTTDPNTPASYDLVIHGPAIATVIVRGVTVAAGTVTATTSTSIGSIAPRDASAYAVNLAPTSAATLQAGAAVRFYQTLPGSGEIPYCIETRAIDPKSRSFASDIMLASNTVDVGSFVSTGATLALSAATPVEGQGVYAVAGTAITYADGPLTTHVAPAGSSTAGTVTVTVPALALATGASAATLTATIQPSVAGTVDQGELIVTQDGAIVDAVVLDTALQQRNGANVTLGNIPGGTLDSTFAAGLYYVTVRTWNSRNPAATRTRQSFLTPVDLRETNALTFSVPVP